MGATMYLFLTILVALLHRFNANDLGPSTQSNQDDDNREEVRKPSLEEKAPFFTHKKRMTKIHIQPTGLTLNLKCKAGGHPAPNITWFKDNEVLTRHLGRISFDHWSLILEKLVVGDSGNYKCLVCNVLGCIAFNYTVDVIERFPSKPYIKDGYPQNVTTLENSTATLECPQMIADLEPFIQWIKSNDFPTESNNGDRVPKGIILQTSATSQNPEILELGSVTRDSEGWYTCVAANKLGETSASAYLRVDIAGEGSRPRPMVLFSFAGIAICSLSVILLQ